MAEEKNLMDEEITIPSHQEYEDGSVEEVFAEIDESSDSQGENIEGDQLLELINKNAELEKKLEEAENRHLRLQADFDNFRRRTKLESEASAKYRSQSLITDLLPALDNFERGLKVEVDSEQTKSILQGMEMVNRSLIEALKNEGVEMIEAVGKEFDPFLHQAIMQVEDENNPSNTIIEEFQKGYLLNDRVIRPSMVKVSQ